MKLFKTITLFTLFSLFLSSIAFGAGLEDKVIERTLKNGMKILIVERHTSPTVALWIRYKVGSVNELSSERGVAHMLEHMLFKGSKTVGTRNYAAEKPVLAEIEKTAQALMAEKLKRDKADKTLISSLSAKLASLEAKENTYVIPNEFSQIYERNGGLTLNAFTAKDTTAYMVNLPSNKLELWAVMESDRMRNAVLRQFYTERNVVMEERRRSYDSEPSGKLWEDFLAAAFVAHPYGQPTIGWASDIENLSRTKAESFLHRFYAPNNAVVAVIGDINPEKTMKLMEKYFASIPPGNDVKPVATVEPRQPGEKRVEVIGDAEPEFLVGFHKPAIATPDDYVFDVIDMILADGRTSRLYKKLVVEQQLAAEVSTFTAPGNIYPGLFIISATPRNPHTVGETEAAIYEEIERLKKEPVSRKELDKVLNNLEADEIRSMGSNGGLAYRLTEYEATAGTWRYLVDHRKKVAKVTPEDVMRVARKYLTEENRTVGFITKREASR
ncbi:MAG TPA: pitrilysin family protein [Geobacteraceae bacterium]|nr:pitrilysin family protein [Geobacteraceae bacterium]